MLAALMLCASSCGGKKGQRSPYEFDDLTTAMGFVIRCIEGDDAASLLKACRHRREVRPYLEPDKHVFDQLKAQHAAKPYDELIAGLSFPADANEYKVGGHGKEFGHLHIDFEKVGDKWCLKHISLCK
jgi:hypothetical protein